MIKVEVVKTNDGKVKLYFETRNTTDDGLDALDVVYQSILGSENKEGGYLDSNRFVITITPED